MRVVVTLNVPPRWLHRLELGYDDRQWYSKSCSEIDTTRAFCPLLYNLSNFFSSHLCGLHHAKRSLMSWVVVIPKEGWARGAALILLLIWHRLFRFFYLELGFFAKPSSYRTIIVLVLKSRCHTKRRAGGATHARPSFGMTQTQDIRDFFA